MALGLRPLGVGEMSDKIQNHQDLRVYQQAFDAAIQVFELSKSFPKEETYALTDQIRRSSRSVCANLAEAWRKRRYEIVGMIDHPETWVKHDNHSSLREEAVDYDNSLP